MNAADLDRLTDEQRRNLGRWSHFPWSLFVSEQTWQQRFAEYLRDAARREQEKEAQDRVDSQRGYFRTIMKVTTYNGPDYRVRFPDQQSWVRVNQWQYEQAARDGVERSIGVPEIVWDPRAVSAAMEDAT